MKTQESACKWRSLLLPSPLMREPVLLNLNELHVLRQREGLGGIAVKVEVQKCVVVHKYGVAGGQSVLVHVGGAGWCQRRQGWCPWWAGCAEVTALPHPRWSGTDDRVLLLLREFGQ